MAELKILIAGTGAVGGYYGLKLLKKGYDVYFTARNKSYEDLLNNGLILDSIETGIEYFKKINVLNFQTLENVDEKFDLILVCVKSYGTEETGKKIKNLIHSGSCVISMQNGIENEVILSKYINAENIAGAVVIISSFFEKNIVKHTGAGKIIIGKISKKTNYDIDFIRNLFLESKINCLISENIMNDLWTKIIWNASFNALSVVIEATVVEMIENENSRNLLKSIMKETIVIAEAAGYKIPFSKIDDNLDMKNNAGEFKTSMLQDYEKKKELEFNYINGAIIRAGEKFGVPAPINKTITEILKFKQKKYLNGAANK